MKDKKPEIISKFLHLLFLVGYLVLLIYGLYLTKYNYYTLIESFKLITQTNQELGSTLMLMLILSLGGIFFVSMIYGKIIGVIFLSKTEEELKLKKKIKELRRKLPYELFELERKKLGKEFQISEINSKIKKYKKRNNLK